MNRKPRYRFSAALALVFSGAAPAMADPGPHDGLERRVANSVVTHGAICNVTMEAES